PRSSPGSRPALRSSRASPSLFRTNERAVPLRNGPLSVTRSLTRFLVLHFGELGVDHVALVLLAGRLGLARGLALRLLLLGLLRGIHLLAELLRRLAERLQLCLDLGLVLRLERALGVLHRGLDLFLLAGVELVAVVLERLLHRVNRRLELVAGVDQLELLLVFLGVRLGVLHHALDLG